MKIGDLYQMTKLFCTKLIVFISLLLLISCAKRPETPLHPSVAVTAENNIFQVNFTCAIANENEYRAFINPNGVITINDNGGSTLLEIPFEIPAILPFATVNIDEWLELSEEAITPLLALLDIDKERIQAGENIGKKYLDEKNVVYKELNLETKDIIELLRGKI